MTDPYYFTPEWRALRQYILERDNYTCVVLGCGDEAVIVDHITSRNAGGDDHPNNLRSLCRLHDNQIKERPRRLGDRRGRDGILPKACDKNGMPLDPDHPWFRAGGQKSK